MPRYRTHMPGSGSGSDDGGNENLTPRQLTKEAFGQRVYNLMVARGWNQSELARRAGLNRDNVSTYITGKSMPSPQNLKRLGDALGVDPDRLLPNNIQAAIERDHPSLEIKVSAHAPGTAWIRLNRFVSTETALAITKLLGADDEAANRERSGRAAALQPDED